MADIDKSLQREVGHAGTSVVPWTGINDPSEVTAELAWPLNLAVYDLMRRTDSQLGGVWKATTYPIRRWNWHIIPNGARPEVVEDLADNVGLPILGQEPKPRPRNRGRFNFRHFLRHALLDLIFGHMFFEQQIRIVERRGRLFADIRKLAPRMPLTISEIKTESDGGLKSIIQYGTGRPGEDPNPEIKVDRLVAFVNDQEGGNWFGTSILRQAYKHWLIKDRLMRVDAMKHEKTGLGVPIWEPPPGATVEQMKALDAMAQRFMAGMGGGVGIPGARLRLVGTEGSVPDTLASIRYHDEQESKLMLAQFLDLGTTGAGNRALGESFIDFFDLALQTIADDHAEVISDHVFEDFVDWNYGEDEPSPQLGYTKNPDPEASIEDLRNLVEGGLLAVDDEVRDWIRQRHRIPARDPDRDDNNEPEIPTTPIYKYDMDYGVVTLNERRKQLGLPPVPEGDVLLTPQNDPAEEPPPGTAAATRKERLIRAAERGRRPLARRPTEVTAALDLPTGRKTRRGLYSHEVTARVDFAQLEEVFVNNRTALLDKWKGIKAKQIEELKTQLGGVVEAIIDGDAIVADIATELDLLNTPEVSGAQVLKDELRAMADEAADIALAEATNQGVTVTLSTAERNLLLAQVEDQAIALDRMLVGSIQEAAIRKATQLADAAAISADPEKLVADVAVYLKGLSDKYLEDQFGGALQTAQNMGRRAVMVKEDGELYASELLDAATCAGCAAKDGAEYDTMETALTDYPSGGYRYCSGGVRCRGTLVKVYAEGDASGPEEVDPPPPPPSPVPEASDPGDLFPEDDDPRAPRPTEDSDPDWVSSLSEAERQDLGAYTASAYTGLNRQLRLTPDIGTWGSNDKISDELAERANNIQNAVLRHPEALEPRVLHRGIRLMDESRNPVAVEDLFPVGGTVELHGFQSTTTLTSKAASFAEISDPGYGAIMEIVTKKGAPISEVSAFGDDEREVLLAHKSRFKVYRIIEAEVDHYGQPTKATIIQLIDPDLT